MLLRRLLVSTAAAAHTCNAIAARGAVLPSRIAPAEPAALFRLLPAYSASALTAAPCRGLKHVARPHLRCKDCYFEVVDEVLYVRCPTHGRHRQTTKTSPKLLGMIMTHATQGAHGQGDGFGRKQMWTQQSFRSDY